MRGANRRLNKRIRQFQFLKANNPGAYEAALNDWIDDLFRLAWIGTEFEKGHGNRQRLALEKVVDKISRIHDPGIRADMLEVLDQKTRGQICNQVERSVETNLMTWPTGARR